MILPQLVALLAAPYFLTLVSAATNYSVDDQDSLAQYSDGWSIITGNMDKDGGHRLTQTPGSYATINYTCAYLLKLN